MKKLKVTLVKYFFLIILKAHDPMMMFTYFLTEISAHFKRPDIVKNITTTLIVNLHRLEMQNS
jgi:hypothetical protein